MNAMVKMVMVAGFFGVAIGAGNVAQAQIRVQPYLLSGSGHSHVPRLGFQGHFDYGYGMHVDHVFYGSPAFRMGLEPGDVIRAINGRWLATQNDYFRELSYSGGYVRLIVQDVRTGRLVTRSAYLGDAVPYGSTGGLQLHGHRGINIRW
jgi:S1-C subfamily serine protease